MKIRKGFVSNSSSSSFCIVGVELNNINIPERLNINNYIKRFDEIDRIEHELYDIAETNGLDLYLTSEDYRFGVIGVDVSNINDNQTFGEFKDDVANKINNIDFENDCKNSLTRNDISVFISSYFPY